MASKEIKVEVSGDASGAKKAFQEAALAAKTAAAEAKKAAAESRAQIAADQAAMSAAKKAAAEAIASAKKAEAATREKVAAYKQEQLALKKVEDAQKAAASAAKKAGQETSDAAKKASSSVGSLNSSLNALAGAATLGIVGEIAKGIADMGISAISAAAKMRQYEVAFSTMLKSAERGKAMLQDLQDFAARTPFDVPGVVEAAQQLVAFGFEAKDIIPTLTTLGDAAAGLGRGSEGVRLMGYALGQIKVSGTLKTQDVNQLVNAGINVWQVLADAAGKSVAEIKDMTEKGMIDSGKAIEVITADMKDRYAGMMDDMNDEVIGLWNNITETIGNSSATIGAYMTDAFGVKDLLKGISEAVDGTGKAFVDARNKGLSFREAVADIVPMPVIAGVGALAAVIGGALVAATVAATAAIATAIGISAPVIGLLAAIGAAVAFVIVYWDKFEDAAAAAAAGVVEALRVVAAAAASLIPATFAACASIVLGFVDEALGAISWLFEEAIGYCPEWLKSMRSTFGDALDAIQSWAADALKWIHKVLAAKDKAAGFTTSGNSDDWDTVSKEFDLYAGFDNPDSKKPNKAPVDLTGSASKTRDKGKSGLSKTETEINRITEALEKAQQATTDLETGFEKLKLDISFEGTEGSDKVYAQIEREKQARLAAVDEVLKKQQEAVAETLTMRANAEKTGDAAAIAGAQALYERRNALLQQSLYEAESHELASGERISGLREQIEQQAADKRISLETQTQAAKAAIQEAFNASSFEKFLELLDAEKVAKMTALEEEQALRQQIYDWRMESEQTMLEWGLQAADTLKNQLAEGFAELVTAGGNFSKKIQEITRNLINMFIQYMAKRQIASVLDRMLGKKETAETVENNAAQAQSAVPAAVNRSIAEKGPVAGPPAYKIALGVGMALGLSAITAHAKGGRAKGWSLVGEEGPELVNFSRPGQVYTADETAAALSGINPNMLSMASASGGAEASGGIGGFLSGMGAMAAGGITAVQNVYGDINNAADLDDLMGGFNDTLAAGVRAT